MRLTAPLLTLVLLAAPARAELPRAAEPALSVPQLQLEQATEQHRTGTTLLRWGVALTLVGLAGAAVGAAELGVAASTRDDGRFAPAARGAIILIAAAPILGTGIPLAVVGERRRQRARALGYGATVALPYLTPTRGGAVAGLQLLTF
jgi:hypothetical protein